MVTEHDQSVVGDQSLPVNLITTSSGDGKWEWWEWDWGIYNRWSICSVWRMNSNYSDGSDRNSFHGDCWNSMGTPCRNCRWKLWDPWFTKFSLAWGGYTTLFIHFPFFQSATGNVLPMRQAWFFGLVSTYIYISIYIYILQPESWLRIRKLEAQ